MNKKKLTIGIVVGAVLLFVILFFANNVVGESLEKKVVGQWVVVPEMNGCDSDLEEGIWINENGTIEGIEGFKDYRIEEVGNQAYLIAGGGYEDLRRYSIEFNEENDLIMQNEKISEGLVCQFEKVE
ncbi:hypothetical protein ACQKDB_15830 [Planococcus kocurii]|uniref:hypothetical protein n=1 Tax=Planococcus kocurii TaxID=1374 RepID=UPI003CFD523F